MTLIGINEGINSSVIAVSNGRVVFALQEERVRKEKNFMGFPSKSLEFTLKYLNLKPQDIEKVCLSNLKSPLISKKEFLSSYDRLAKESIVKDFYRKNQSKIPSSLKKVKKAFFPEVKNNSVIEKNLEEFGFSQKQIFRAPHHLNHGASAYFGLRKNAHEPHLVITLDGGGDDSCSQVYIAQGKEMKLIAHTPLGHSIGNVYSRITHYMGMTPHEHEYKLMGLSAYANELDYSAPIVQKLKRYVDLDPKNPMIFKSGVPEKTYACEKRIAKDFLRTRFDNLAAGIQFYTEDLMVRWIKHLVKATGIKNIVAAGGVFMNVKANKLIASLPEVEFFDVFPSCGDETLPFGSAWYYYAQNSAKNGDDIVFDSFSLGPDASFDFSEAEKKYQSKFHFRKVENPEKEAAEIIAKGDVLAYCSGPMEFGARALGNRSLVADPKNQEVVTEINKMIKHRDFWMPFAPAMIKERAQDYIQIPHGVPQKTISAYMMQTFDTTSRSPEFTAAVHAYDKTARAQVVSADIHPKFHKLIREFEKITGKGVVLNTSFNMHGEPLVMGAIDALKVMERTTLKYLLVNDILVTKK